VIIRATGVERRKRLTFPEVVHRQYGIQTGP
jgi:hypothetical protein